MKKARKEICCIKECGRPVEILKHMLCKTHYIRLIRVGDPFANVPIEPRRKIQAYKP